MRVAGVDGTKGGWAAIVLDDGVFARDELLTSIDSEFAALSDAKVIGVDVPIGYGPREADRAARAFLTGGASTVFTTPPRSLLEMQFGPGCGLSAQSHALGPRIIHVTELAARAPRFRKVHPEAVSGDEPWSSAALSQEERRRRAGADRASPP